MSVIISNQIFLQQCPIGYVHAELTHTTGILLVAPVHGPKFEVILEHINPVNDIYYHPATTCQPLIDHEVFYCLSISKHHSVKPLAEHKTVVKPVNDIDISDVNDPLKGITSKPHEFAQLN
jgi:N-dimethylarginine dimethylaminohydrolase